MNQACKGQWCHISSYICWTFLKRYNNGEC